MAAADPLATALEPQRLKILDATERLVAVRGVDAIRLRDVSQEAKVSIGSIQHYFNTRDELVSVAMRNASRRRAAEWSTLARQHDRASDKIAALLCGSISDRHRCVLWIETCAASTRHEELAADVNNNFEAWRTAFEEAVRHGVSTGEFNLKLSIRELVDTFVAVIDGFMLAVAVGQSGMTVDYRAHLLHNMARRLLGSGYKPRPTAVGGAPS